MFQFHVSCNGIYSSLLNNLTRESGLTSRISGIFAPSFATVMSIEAVHNLIHCWLEVLFPLEDVSTLGATGMLLRILVQIAFIGRRFWNIDYRILVFLSSFVFVCTLDLAVHLAILLSLLSNCFRRSQHYSCVNAAYWGKIADMIRCWMSLELRV